MASESESMALIRSKGNGDEDDVDANSQRSKAFGEAKVNTNDEDHSRVMTGEEEMTLTSRLRLSAGLMGAEASTAFEQLYTVPNLQTLGTPLSLVSITGLIAGPTASVLVLLMGCFSDRGSNPVQRRRWMLAMSTLIAIAGMVAVCAANLIHLKYYAFESGQHASHHTVTSFDVTSSASSGVLPRVTRGVTSKPPNASTAPVSASLAATVFHLAETRTSPLSASSYSSTSLVSANLKETIPNLADTTTSPVLASTNASTTISSTTLTETMPNLAETTTSPVSASLKETASNLAETTFSPVSGGSNFSTTQVSTRISPNVSTTTPASSSGLPWTAALGIVGFVLLDVGYDSVSATTRTWMLTCCPNPQHGAVLAAGLVVTSLGGMTSSGLGVIDLPAVLGLSAAEGSGLAIQICIQGAVVVLVVVVVVLCSLLEGNRQLRHRGLRPSHDTATPQDPSSVPSLVLDTDLPVSHQRQAYSERDIDIQHQSLLQDGVTVTERPLEHSQDLVDCIHPTSSVVSTPVGQSILTSSSLYEQRNLPNSVLGFHERQNMPKNDRCVPVSGLNENVDSPNATPCQSRHVPNSRLHDSQTAGNTVNQRTPFSSDTDKVKSLLPHGVTQYGTLVSSTSPSKYKHASEDSQHSVSPTESSKNKQDAKDRHSFASSSKSSKDEQTSEDRQRFVSPTESSTDEQATESRQSFACSSKSSKDEEAGEDRQQLESAWSSSSEAGSQRHLIPANSENSCRKTWCRVRWGFKTRVAILCGSAYFTVATVVVFILNSSDFVGKAIYQGDPAGLIGSDSLARYQKGIRMTSYGFFVYYAIYLCFGILQPRVLRVFGYTLEFVSVQLWMVVCLVVMALTARLETFFLACAVAGVHRAVFHVVPFALISDVVHAEAESRGGGQRARLGLTMSAMTITMPLAYSTLYPWVGVLEDVTGVVAVPMWVAAASSALSAILFLLLGV